MNIHLVYLSVPQVFWDPIQNRVSRRFALLEALYLEALLYFYFIIVYIVLLYIFRYIITYPYIFHPIRGIIQTAAIFMVVAVTTERYRYVFLYFFQRFLLRVFK